MPCPLQSRYWNGVACYPSTVGNATARSFPDGHRLRPRSAFGPSARGDRGHGSMFRERRSRCVSTACGASSRLCGVQRRYRRGACPGWLVFLGASFCSWPKFNSRLGTKSTPSGNFIFLFALSVVDGSSHNTHMFIRFNELDKVRTVAALRAFISHFRHESAKR